MGRLQDKIAIVTGGASRPGLGSSTAIRFAQEGAVVFVTDIDLDGAEAVAADIRESGGLATAIQHDVANAADWDRLFDTVRSRHGRLDALVNNAGVVIHGLIANYKDDQWKRQVDINLNSVFYGTQRAVELMREVGQGGSIINISSGAGLIGVPGASAYSATKGGVRLFSKSIALECATDGIRVNSVHPGMIRTNISAISERENPEEFQQQVNAIPMRQFGDPMDIANMNLFLASDESRYVTGTELVVDGGFTAQ
ncbi:SDR family NAD(P)-dependent oxidoreductase [Rhodococcus opacus]|uniref:SDR family NAD(P)-dependent oxidoreductase n=1 Tax=Rhodococcus opacus TaxID=37919 RepID=UPI002473A34C|nr:glucose 1-dehydrogenase [Rhodococcus opacus]MDH6293529.1 NAD(P)-dependent dehydrogenase (short-subunit alcohol dehydrogenase family) [Rhodococcus opacus]